MAAFDRRKFLSRSAWFSLGIGALPELMFAQQDLDPERTAVNMLTPETGHAINHGLAYLTSRQNDDGSLGSGGYSRNVAIAGLAGMAFVASGSSSGRGPYGRNIERCIGFLLDNTQDSGFIMVTGAASHGPMYGHGFATLFLSEVYGMTGRPDIREKLGRAINLIINTQNADGGWRYQPQRRDADISVTICQVMALRAARNAGVYVPNETIDRCIDYVKRSQNTDGGSMYMIHGGPSAFPRSAAGIVALYSSGIYQGDEISRSLEYLMTHLPRGEMFSHESHYFYGHYYAVQAMWHAGGQYWQRWYPAVRDSLIARQRDDGSWMDSINPEYGTAMAALILQMPNNYLPIFQR